MKKLLILMLVLGLANVTSAAIHFELMATDLGGGDYSIDIYATDPGAVATHLISSGELLLTIMGDAAIIPSFVYSFGSIHQEIVAPDGKSGKFGAATDSTLPMFWLIMPDETQGNIIVTLNSSIATVTVTPNNEPNPFGNTVYYDGTQPVTDLEATGSSVVIPEPMTIALLGLGGLLLLRRRQN
ncbi:MAG: PEP-CTERM sorting domain-containing protein [Planctomycetota bacterium]|jgi:hypothetical protein